jgi:hypothetical protein
MSRQDLPNRPGFDSRYESIYQRGGPEPVRGHESTPADPVVPVHAEPAADEDTAGARPVRPGINPYLVGLWLFGLLITGLGIWAAAYPYTVTPDDPSVVGDNAFGAPWFLALTFLSPGILAAGLGILGAALAVQALGWQRQRERSMPAG